MVPLAIFLCLVVEVTFKIFFDIFVAGTGSAACKVAWVDWGGDV